APAMDGVGYAVTFVAAPEGVAAKMRTGGEGRCKVWLNGELAYRSDDEVWAFRAEEEVTDVTLRKGVNVLVAKVARQREGWSYRLRFTDENGRLLAGLQVKAPE